MVSAESDPRVAVEPDFQVVSAVQCPAHILHEIGEFLDTQDTSHPFQFPEWSGSGALLALARRGGRVSWVAQCGTLSPGGQLLPIRALTVYRGPVCDDVELLETGLRHLIEAGRRKNLAYVEIAPEWSGGFAESAALMLARNGWQTLAGERSSLRLGLNRAADDLLASFRKTTRSEIRRSISAGIVVTVAGNEIEYRDFLRLYEAMASERKFPAQESEFLLRIFHWLAVDRSRGGLFLAWEDGNLRGGALVVRAGRRCWYILGATSKDGKVGVGHLLQWRAIEWAREMGCLEYDFGGYREGVNTGPALFKKGFCDRVVNFIPPYRYVTSPTRHRAVESIAKIRRKLHL